MRILWNVSSRRSTVSLLLRFDRLARLVLGLRRFAMVATCAMGAAGAAGTLGACMGPTFVVQQYGGPVRPRETIATLRVNGSDPVRLITLDDEDVRSPLDSDSRLHIELLPGRHKIGIASGGEDVVTPAVFVAEAGKVYRAAYVGKDARVYEVDRGSDSPGRDVTAGSPVAAP
jgi:hypothetical protein